MMLGDTTTTAVLAGRSSASLSPPLSQTLDLVEKLTCEFEQISMADIYALRSLGVSVEQIVEAAAICVGFNVITRVAEAFAFSVPNDQVFTDCARFLARHGYWILGGFSVGTQQLRPICSAISGTVTWLAFDDLVGRILRGPGFVSPELRSAVATNQTALPQPLGVYIDKVHDDAHKITDGEMADLRKAGYSEDQIFELTVSAALGAGLARWSAAANALREALSRGNRQQVDDELSMRMPSMRRGR